MLGKLGLKADIASDGQEALSLAEKHRYDLILMDCEMPEMDGFESSRAIVGLQKEKRLLATPIVALTAHAVPDKIQACHEAGMVGHLAKPINIERLQNTLKQILRDPDIRLANRP